MTDLTPNEQKRRDLLSLIADAIGQAEGSPECFPSLCSAERSSAGESLNGEKNMEILQLDEKQLDAWDDDKKGKMINWLLQQTEVEVGSKIHEGINWELPPELGIRYYD